MMPCDYRAYPANWKETRARIMERENHRCEVCNIKDHAVGYRDSAGNFIACGGNAVLDAAAEGLQYPSFDRLSFRQAQEIADVQNDCHVESVRPGVMRKKPTDAEGNRWFVVVLTVAHLDEDGPKDCSDDRLRMWCQACHNRHDAKMRAQHRQERVNSMAATLQRVLDLPVGRQIAGEAGLTRNDAGEGVAG